MMPKKIRGLDNIYFRVQRGDAFMNLSFSDLTKEEQLEILKDKSPEFKEQLAILLAEELYKLGETLDLERIQKNES